MSTSAFRRGRSCWRTLFGGCRWEEKSPGINPWASFRSGWANQRSIDRTTERFVDGAGGGDDQVAVEELDGGFAAAFDPEFGVDDGLDELDELVGAGLGVAGLHLLLAGLIRGGEET